MYYRPGHVAAAGDRPVLEFDLPFIRAQFPAFSDTALADFGFFENAGGSYPCIQVIDRLNRYYSRMRVQPYYDYSPSREAGEQMDSARTRMAAWLNVAPDEVHFGPSTTQNTYVLAQALRQYLQPGDEVIVSNQDHEANIGPWRRLESAGIVIREWQIDPADGELKTEDLDSLLGPRTRVVAFTHCSNTVASINPVREWTDRIHRSGAIAIVDGVSYCPHGLPDLRALGADIYLFSLYKVYGPHQGVMYMSSELNRALPNQGHYFNADKPSHRFTPAGPDHAQIAASNGVIDYFETLYQHHFKGPATPAEQARQLNQLLRNRESELLQPLLDFLAGEQRVRLLGQTEARHRAPTVAFTVQGMPAAQLASRLAAQGLGVAAGHFYAARLLEAMSIDLGQGAVRASLVHYTDENEVARLIAALQQLIAHPTTGSN